MFNTAEFSVTNNLQDNTPNNQTHPSCLISQPQLKHVNRIQSDHYQAKQPLMQNARMRNAFPFVQYSILLHMRKHGENESEKVRKHNLTEFTKDGVGIGIVEALEQEPNLVGDECGEKYHCDREV